MKRSVFFLVRALLAAVLIGGIHGQAAAQQKLRVGLLPFSESLGAVMAERLGYFRDEGLEVEVSLFNSGALALPLLQAGKLDIAFSNTVATLQAMEQGLDAMLLAPGAVVGDHPPDSTTALLALKGTLATPKALEGKRIAVNVINSSAWLYLVAYLDKVGVERSKVRFVEIPFPQMNNPLLAGQVDAIAQVEPFRTLLLDTGKVDTLAYTYVESQPNAEITQYIALSAWVRKNPAIAARFVRAVVKGSAYVNANPAAARDANLDFTHLNPAMKDRVQIPPLGVRENLAEIRRTMELMLKYGLLKKPVELEGHAFEPR